MRSRPPAPLPDHTRATSGRLVLDGFEHAYHAWLPGPARTACPALDAGSALVALHGFGTTGYRTFRYVAPRLGRAGVPLYAPDLLGFGGSARPAEGYSLRQYASLTAAFADALDLERPFLLGHSFGGKVAAATVALYPHRFAGLVLVNPGGFSVLARWMPPVAEAPLTRWLFRQGWFVRHVLPRTPLGPVFPDVASIEQFLRWRRSHRAPRLGPRRPAPGATTDGRPPPSCSGARTTRSCPPPPSATSSATCPHADVRRLAGAGHAPMKDQPERFAEAVAAFLRGRGR